MMTETNSSTQQSTVKLNVGIWRTAGGKTVAIMFKRAGRWQGFMVSTGEPKFYNNDGTVIDSDRMYNIVSEVEKIEEAEADGSATVTLGEHSKPGPMTTNAECDGVEIGDAFGMPLSCGDMILWDGHWCRFCGIDSTGQAVIELLHVAFLNRQSAFRVVHPSELKTKNDKWRVGVRILTSRQSPDPYLLSWLGDDIPVLGRNETVIAEEFIELKRLEPGA